MATDSQPPTAETRLTDERRAEIERAIAEAEGPWFGSKGVELSCMARIVRELLAEIARLNETLSSRSELAATTIAGLEMENARLKAECDTLRVALHHREGKAESHEHRST